MGTYELPSAATEPRCTCRAADYALHLLCPVHIKFVKRCKHCELKISSCNGAPHTWRHAEGPQTGLNRCALDPYGYDAAPADEPCSFACRGYVGSDPAP